MDKKNEEYQYMKYMSLDSGIYDKIMEVAVITDKIESYYSKDNETFIYYVINGYVDVYNHTQSQYIS